MKTMLLKSVVSGTGAERTEIYLPWLAGKNVAVVANQTSMINGTSLVDSLIALKAFAFRLSAFTMYRLSLSD